MHAAGVVISEGPLWDHVPCFMNGEMIVTQYYKDDVEQAGLVKFDFLGLKTLTVIDIAVRLINQRPDLKGQPKFDASVVPLDDAVTYALLQSGDTTGVFQLESSGMQQLFKDLKPDAFEDIVAAVALYRPGPLGTGMVKDFVDCKHKRKPIEKMHDLVDELLAPTYGVIVYQEQVMQIAQRLAGYSLGGADLLRRAMGKKKPEEMAKQKATFVDGSIKNGVKAEDAERIFALLEFFAGYGFNKSHSAAYALLTYQTAYLKAHYPVEFLCALMTADRDKIEKVVRIIAEGRAWGVEILPPAINESKTDFTVVYSAPRSNGAKGKDRKTLRVKDALEPKIRFGMGAIRGVGETALEAVLEVRNAGGPFADLFDFAQRVDARRVNKGVFESLVQCGAFDDSPQVAGDHPRPRLRGDRSSAGALAQQPARIASAGSRRSSGSSARPSPRSPARGLPDVRALGSARDAGAREAVARLLRLRPPARSLRPRSQPPQRRPRRIARGDAAVDQGARRRDGRGLPREDLQGRRRQVAFFILEDTNGRIEVKVRQNQIETYAHVLTAGEPVLISGKLSFPQQEEGEESEGPREPTLLLDMAESLADAIRLETKHVAIHVNERRADRDHLSRLARVLAESPGACPVQLFIRFEDGNEAVLALPRYRVEPNDGMLARLEKLFGEKVAELR